MTPKNTAGADEDDTFGVLDDTASLDTSALGILGGTAHVAVNLPTEDYDDLADDGVVDDEMDASLLDVSALEAPERAEQESVAQIAQSGGSFVIELPAVECDAAPETTVDDADEADADEPETVEVEIIEDDIVEDEVLEPEVIEPELIETAAVETVEPAVVAEFDQPEPEPEPEPVAAEPAIVLAQTPVAPVSVPPVSDTEARPEENTAVHTDDAPVARPAAEVTLASKRLDDLGESSRESADLLTADRLLDPHRVAKPEPEGTWSHLLYTLSGHRLNIGDGRRARERKALTARIAAPLAGSARFVPVLSRKGGVGKTTVTALLGMALADARDDRVIAVDANPDRGTLAERVVGSHGKSVRDLVRQQHDIRGYHDVSALVARDETRLDVLASDADPRVSEAFGDSDYRDVATVAAQYYSLVLTDSGTGIVHSVMDATLDLADQIVIVSGLSVDEARLASETLTWLETNGRAGLAREAIVVLNQSTPGAPMVRLNELEAHFSTRAKHVVRVPYDPQVAGGGAIDFASLRPETRQAARELAARLIQGLRTRAA